MGHWVYGALNQPRTTAQLAEVQTNKVEKAALKATSDHTAYPGEIALESKGYVTPVHQIQVSPKVSGTIVRLHFEEGQRVQKGSILAQLETTDYQADYDHTLATVEAARQRLLELSNGNREEEKGRSEAALREAEEQHSQLRDEAGRVRRSGRAVSAEEAVRIESRRRQAEHKVRQLREEYRMMLEGPRRERIEAARFDLRAAEAELAKAKWRLDNCTIRAPISGTVLTKIAEEGNIVNQLALNLKGSLCDMADLSDLEGDLVIQERDVAKVYKGQRCKIRSEAFPDRVYEGTVSRLMPIADRAKGAIPVRVKVMVPQEEEGIYLKPEMGIIVSFLK
jgi:multidrug resistance efflux pump